MVKRREGIAPSPTDETRARMAANRFTAHAHTDLMTPMENEPSARLRGAYSLHGRVWNIVPGLVTR